MNSIKLGFIFIVLCFKTKAQNNYCQIDLGYNLPLFGYEEYGYFNKNPTSSLFSDSKNETNLIPNSIIGINIGKSIEKYDIQFSVNYLNSSLYKRNVSYGEGGFSSEFITQQLQFNPNISYYLLHKSKFKFFGKIGLIVSKNWIENYYSVFDDIPPYEIEYKLKPINSISFGVNSSIGGHFMINKSLIIVSELGASLIFLPKTNFETIEYKENGLSKPITSARPAYPNGQSFNSHSLFFKTGLRILLK